MSSTRGDSGGGTAAVPAGNRNYREFIRSFTLLIPAAVGSCAADISMLRRPDRLSRAENHLSWSFIHLLTIAAIAALAIAYLQEG